MVLSWLIFALIGMLAGLLGGLLGVGGGFITVPSLLLVFGILDFSEAYKMQIAIGTSLGAMVFTAASSAWRHYLNNGIVWPIFFSLSPGLILGSFLGVMIAIYLPGYLLAILFGFFACLSGIYFLLFTYDTEEKIKPVHHSCLILFTLTGVGIGATSSLLGIGGGIITVPILIAFQIPVRNAISTSAILSLLNACIGAFSYLYAGLGKQTCDACVGYLYLPAFIIMGITSSLLAIYGAKQAYLLPVLILRRGFGLLLLVVGMTMLYFNLN